MVIGSTLHVTTLDPHDCRVVDPTGAGAPAVTLAGVSLTRGQRSVLRDVSFELKSGEFVGLLGPNGAGKTTLMHALLGLLPIVAGEMRVLGRPPGRGNPAIGYMPQQRTTIGSLRLSGHDFVAGVVRGHRWGLPLLDRDSRREVAWALEMVGGA